jgi:DNA polymerase, archaea type
MNLDDFFLDNPKPANVIVKTENNGESKLQEDIQKIEIEKNWKPTYFDIGEDIDNVFLLDSVYDGEAAKVQLIFYDPKTKSLYRWFDTTGHLPYLVTHLSEEEIKSIPKVANSADLVKIESVQKKDLLLNKTVNVRKVYGKNPLNIGGTNDSFKNFINPSFEDDIRYHYNYICDYGISPASFYSVKSGKLISQKPKLSEDIVNQLNKEFEGEKQEELNMLDEYMPILFQDIPDILRAAYDIEVGSDENKMPNKNNPLDPIISIALADIHKKKIFWVLNRPEVDQKYKENEIDIRRFDSERDMLVDFFETINQYPIVISFNGDNFDNPYLFNRAKKLKIEDIPIQLKQRLTTFSYSIHFDLYIFFRQAAIRLYAFGGAYESTSLDEVSTGLLGIGKYEHPEIWINKMDLKTLLKYNMRDTEITLDLTTFNKNLVMNLIITLMRITKVPFIDFSRMTVSTWLKIWLIWEHRKRNFLIPSKEDIQTKAGIGYSEAIIEGKKFQGAIVIDPKPGIWWNVQVLDFASLYPSIIKTKNLSYETINCIHEDCKNTVPEVNHKVCSKEVGIMSLIIGFIRDIRVKYFKPRKRENPHFEVMEQALKVLINAGYGVIGSTNFDFYCLPVAESTTAYARHAITQTKEFVEKTLNVQVLYGDTDSVFIYQPTDDDIDRLKSWSITNLGIEIGKDYDFRFAIFSSLKKNYLGITSNGYPIVKGLMGKKKNTPNIIRGYFKNMLDILGEVQTNEELKEAIGKIKLNLKELVNKIENNDLKIEDVIIRTTLTNRLKEYTTWTQPVQAIAQLLEKQISGAEQLDIGDQIEYVPIDRQIPVTIVSNRLAFAENETKMANVKPVQLIDQSKDTFGKNLLSMTESAFKQIIQPMGINWDKDIMGQQNIDEFF